MSEGDDAKATENEEAEAEAENGEAADAPEGEDADSENAEAEDEAPAKKGLSGKLKIIIIAVAALLVLGGGGAGLWFSGVFSSNNERSATIDLPGPPVFYEVPQITVDLKPTAQRARPFIRLEIQIELQGDSAKQAVINNEPRILDAMQSHLRDTTAEELQGKLGTEQLREDLTAITNRFIAPEHAITVRFMRILIR